MRPFRGAVPRQIASFLAESVPTAYAWYRQKGDTAEQAWRHAKTAVEFFVTPGCYTDNDEDALVRLTWEPEWEAHDADYVDTWGLSPKKATKEKKRIYAMVESEGLWVLCAQWRMSTDDAWETCDSVGDMIGTDYTGYEPGMMRSALDAFRRALDLDASTRATELAQRATLAGPSGEGDTLS